MPKSFTDALERFDLAHIAHFAAEFHDAELGRPDGTKADLIEALRQDLRRRADLVPLDSSAREGLTLIFEADRAGIPDRMWRC